MARERYPSERLVEQARDLIHSRGEGLTMMEFCRAVGVSPAAIQLKFGGWGSLRERAGYSRHRPRRGRHSQDSILEQLRKWAAREGSDISRHTFLRLSGLCDATIQRYFGSWTKLREYADLPPTRRGTLKYTETDLMRELHQVAKELGRIPRSTEFARRSRISRATYYSRLGKWKIVVALYEIYLSRLKQWRTGVSGEV